jgi:hypothetical protein
MDKARQLGGASCCVSVMGMVCTAVVLGVIIPLYMVGY